MASGVDVMTRLIAEKPTMLVVDDETHDVERAGFLGRQTGESRQRAGAEDQQRLLHQPCPGK